MSGAKTPLSRTLALLGLGGRTLGRVALRRLAGTPDADGTERHWQAVGQDWVKTLASLRGAAMKLGQLASQYGDLLPPALAEQLRLLQNAAPPLPYAQVLPLLQAQWSASQAAAIGEIEPQALASASIGQVHAATLVDGRAVVVKLRYPGVQEAVDADLVQLRRLIGLSKLLPLEPAALDALMAELRARFREETDYRRELAALLHMRRVACWPGIVYPEPLPELCADGVLVMNRESGDSLEQARLAPLALRQQWALALAGWFLHCLFSARAVHADPHPGNFAFRSNGQVVVYDMGCTKRLRAETVQTLRRLLKAALCKDWPRVHRQLLQLGAVGNAEVSERQCQLYAGFCTLSLDRLCADSGFDFADASFIDDLRTWARRNLAAAFEFAPVPELAFVMRELSGLYWLLRALAVSLPVGTLLQASLAAAPAAVPD